MYCKALILRQIIQLKNLKFKFYFLFQKLDYGLSLNLNLNMNFGSLYCQISKYEILTINCVEFKKIFCMKSDTYFVWLISNMFSVKKIETYIL